MQDLPAFLLAGFALTYSPGPATLSLAAIGAAFGARRGLGYMAGLLAGMVLVMTVVATGVIGVVLAAPGVEPAVALLAAAYILYLAWRIATAPPISSETGDRRAPAFSAGVLLQLVNVKAYAAMAALFTGFTLIADAAALDAFTKAGVLLAMIAVGNCGWLIAGSMLTRFLRDPRANRIVNLAFAAMLVASVAFAFLVESGSKEGPPGV